MSRILYGHAPSLTSPLSPVEVEALPSHRVVLSQWSSVLWPPPTSHPASPWTSLLQLIRRTISLYQRLRWLWTTHQMRPPLRSTASMRCSIAYFHNIPLPLRRRVLHGCTPGSSPLPWPSLSLTSSAPSGSRCRANISTLQDSLYVTGCCFALLPQERTPLQHNRLPGSTGSLLRGLLAVTTVGLSPTSRRQLSGHTTALLAAFPLWY